MLESKETRRRVESGVYQVALLDEIAERLLAIETHNKEISPEGIVEPLTETTVTTTPIVFEPILIGVWS